ncbi:MAG: alpha/beta hydrolase [Vicinamibacterales bacterium]|nr:alpha/beta hydrolase [Vicinamibacterales bacterium]
MGEWSREDVRFDSHGDECAAWLYKPDGVERPPVVVLCHGLGAVREMRLDAFAERFAAAGMAAFAFTYRGFGDSGGEPRQVLDIGMQHDDIKTAIAYVRGREDLDGERVALWGSSFGGGHVMVVGARDPKLKAIVSQCPFTDGLVAGLTVGPVTTAKLTGRGIKDTIGKLRGMVTSYVRLFGRAGDAALMTAPDVVAGVERLIDGLDYPVEVAARVGLEIPLYRPGRQLKNIKVPTLVCICDADTVAPPKTAIKYVGEAANAEAMIYTCGHFDIYFDEPFEFAVTDQIEFLSKHLGVAAPVAAATA